MPTNNNGINHGLMTFEYPTHLQHPFGRTNLIAADLLEYYANKGIIPRYTGLINGLREDADEIFKIAKRT